MLACFDVLCAMNKQNLQICGPGADLKLSWFPSCLQWSGSRAKQKVSGFHKGEQ